MRKVYNLPFYYTIYSPQVLLRHFHYRDVAIMKMKNHLTQNKTADGKTAGLRQAQSPQPTLKTAIFG